MKNGTIDLVICPKCEAEIVVDVNEGEPTAPLSVVEDVLSKMVGNGITMNAKNEMLKNIKQKAGL